uniref:Polymerase (DNA directed) nu n=1 Tax=Mastacembelus armatus TaxID=205130 RepID=A0A3Q3MQU0_9TELE
MILSFPLKRKYQALQQQNTNSPSKIHLPRCRPKWEPPCISQEKEEAGGISVWKRAMPKASIPEYPAAPPELQTKASVSHGKGIMLGAHIDSFVLQHTQQRQSKIEDRDHEYAKNTYKHTPSSMTCKPPNHVLTNCESDQGTDRSKTSNHRDNTGVSQPQTTAGGSLTATLTSDPRIKDSGKLNQDEKMQMLEEAGQAKTLVLTMVYQDGTTQLDPEQKLTPPVCGLLVLMKNDLYCSTSEGVLEPNDSLIYLKLDQTPVWAKQHMCVSVSYRDMLLQVLSGSPLVVCFKAKDFLRTALQFYKQDLNWKKVADCHIQDPQVSGWLLDPADPSSCYQDLLNKHCKRPYTTSALGTKKVMFTGVVSAMESHCIHVDREALKRTSDLLGTRMKQLEQEAHRAAGQKFLVTSNTQLRTVLFEKLRLHERCENKKLPKTINKQQQSTSEAAVHKIKSTFVDGILSCMIGKVSLQLLSDKICSKGQCAQEFLRVLCLVPTGKEEEVVTVHPRAMFIPQEGWTFIAADFCQVELRLLAHLSSDPELLDIFTNPQADVFTMLASQWKGKSETEVTSEDREHAKRIVYSVVYGAGRERLSGILGVSAEQASQFQDSFLQTYRDVQAFIQRIIQQCHKQGYVLSIMGRRRSLPNINSPEWGARMQAERQAVNFVVQGRLNDSCMLIAQLHDELLYEVEDSQVEHFAGECTISYQT